jgi:hypothetical protein
MTLSNVIAKFVLLQSTQNKITVENSQFERVYATKRPVVYIYVSSIYIICFTFDFIGEQ